MQQRVPLNGAKALAADRGPDYRGRVTIRDLGYRPYTGKRLPSSNSFLVLYRFALRKAWRSWLVKLSLFFGWGPLAVACVVWYVQLTIFANAEVPAGARPGVSDLGDMMHTLGAAQLWLFGTLIALGAGAGTIARDNAQRAFPFFFAKPVSPAQYIAGHVAAVFTWAFAMIYVPLMFFGAFVAATVNPELRFSAAGLLLAAIPYSVLVAGAIATTSVGLSSLSKSRAFTMTTWAIGFLVPTVAAWLIEELVEWPWLGLLSLPRLCEVLGNALFKVEASESIQPWHAAAMLALWIVGSVAVALRRVRGAEVVA